MYTTSPVIQWTLMTAEQLFLSKTPLCTGSPPHEEITLHFLVSLLGEGTVPRNRVKVLGAGSQNTETLFTTAFCLVGPDQI